LIISWRTELVAQGLMLGQPRSQRCSPAPGTPRQPRPRSTRS
jgi:hypothetical protein